MKHQAISHRAVLVLLRAVLLLAVGVPPLTFGQDGKKPEPIQYPAERVEQLARSFNGLKKDAKLPVPAAEEEQGVFAIADGVYVASKFLPPANTSVHAVVQIRMANLTDKPYSFTTSTIRLNVDDEQLVHQMLPQRLSSVSINNGTRLTINPTTTKAQEDLEPGQVKTILATFYDLPADMPYRKFEVIVGGLPQPVRSDLMATTLANLGMSSKRIGPRECLGVITINKRLDSLSTHHVVHEMDRLHQKGSTRIALVFGDSAERLQFKTSQWLDEQANGQGVRRVLGYPQMPRTVAALHTGPKPAVSPTGIRVNAFSHASNRKAIAAALLDVYQQLPIADVMRDIDSGSSEVKAAAIRGGAGRLPDSLLPGLIELAKTSPDSFMQESATVALGHFADQEAIDCILATVTSGNTKLVDTAVETLARSRFPEAQQALKQVLVSEESKLEARTRDSIARKLMSPAEPLWRELYFEYASRKDTAATVALKALKDVGHPELTSLLKEKLKSKNSSMRKMAFQSLVRSRDPEQLEIAMAYTVEFIQKSPPTTEMISFLRNRSSVEVAALLIERYGEQNLGSERRRLLDAIRYAGDESMLSFYAKVLDDPKVPDSQKTTPLTVVRELDPESATKYAYKFLESRDPNLMANAFMVLEDAPTPETVRVAGDLAISTTDDSRALKAIATLARISTPEARRYLRLLENGKREKRREAAGRALLDYARSSPALLLLNEARELREANKLDEAEAAFEKGKKVDPQFAELYVQHGHMLTHSDRRKLGVAEFDKALAVDPLHPIASSLKFIAVVVLGDVEGGLKMVEDNRERFQYDETYNYNAACAYGQAIKNTKANADNVEKIGAWKLKGIEYLELCINQLGFSDPELFKTDPDLEPFREMPRFKVLKKKLDPLGDSPDEDDDN